MNEIIYPVVIVGKDRTRMTCEVARRLNEKLLNCKPYFIVVSDRSRVGHCEAIQGFFQRELPGVKFEVRELETSSDRFGWGAAMNIGLERAFQISDSAILVDNDWILQRTILVDHLAEVLRSTPMGCVSFKAIPKNHDYMVQERIFGNFKFDVRTETADGIFSGGRPNYVVEIGCMAISKRFFEKVGKFKENVNHTDDVEYDFISRFSKIPPDFREKENILYGNFTEFRHEQLNGPGHVFTHIGMDSQSGRKQKWGIPVRYFDLNDPKKDEAFCQLEISRLEGSDFKINWEKHFDRVYCIYFLPKRNRMQRLCHEFKRVGLLDSPVFEWRYTTPSRYDKLILNNASPKYKIIELGYVNHILEVQRIMKEAKLLGYKRIAIVEDDVAFLKDKREIENILLDIPEDFGCSQLDKLVPAGKIKETYERFLGSRRINSHFIDASNFNFTSAAFNVFTPKGMDDCIKVLDSILCSTDRMFELIKDGRAVATRNICIQLWYDNCVARHYEKCNKMHEMYLNQGIDYSNYEVPDGYGPGKFVTVDSAEASSSAFITGEHVIGDKCKGRKKVSVYAIAYNESRNIDKWYSCVSEADEVVVLDTGSTDDTVEKLRKLGAHVEVEKFDKWNSVEEYDAIVARGGNPWRFDKARNDSLKLVAEDSDILVTIDIDEFMQPGWRKNLEDQWIAAEESGKHPTCAAYKYVWCYNPDGTEARTFEIHKIHARGVCHWTHMIHEVLHYDSGERPFWLKDFVVEHHQDLSKTRKSYLPMLAVEARDMPENDRSAHYYGRELMYEGRWDESIAELKRHLSLRASGWRAERAASMRYIANCYAGKGDSEMEEFWLWKAAMEDPNHREASFRLGEIYMSRKDWRSAERAWEFCLNIKNRSQEYISDNRCWSAIPHLKYAQALWWDGNWRAACEQAEIAVQMEPSNKEAIAQRDGMQATRKQHNR